MHSRLMASQGFVDRRCLLGYDKSPLLDAAVSSCVMRTLIWSSRLFHGSSRRLQVFSFG